MVVIIIDGVHWGDRRRGLRDGDAHGHDDVEAEASRGSWPGVIRDCRKVPVSL